MKSKNNSHEEQDDIEFLTDLLLETNLSIAAIANELDWPIAKVNKVINYTGLSWIKDQRKKMSRGQSALTAIMQKLLPGEKIVNEFHIGDKLKLDVYCPRYSLAAEYHGRQHFYYTSRFYESKYDFDQALIRDAKKEEWCKQNGIALIVFRYNDSLTEQAVFDRMLYALRSNPIVSKEKTKNSIVDKDFYQKRKKQNSDRRKLAYKAYKDKKKNDRRTGK